MSNTERAYFRVAWRVFRAQPSVFIAGAIVPFLLWALLEILVISFSNLGVIVNVILHLLFMFLISGAMVGLHGIALQGVAGKTVEIRELVAHLTRGPHFLAATILYVLGIILSCALLILPGIYFAVRYALFPQVLASREVGPVEALHLAGEVTKNQWWHVAGVLARAFLLTLLGTAVLGIGAFITFPWAVIACSSLYTTLLSNGELSPDARPKA
jgi:hypothetical protein